VGSVMMGPVVDLDKCIHCNICDEVCPGDVIVMRNGWPVIQYPEECWFCGACRLDCPTDCFTFIFPPVMLGR